MHFITAGMTSDLYLDLLKKCLTASIYEESAWKLVESKPLQLVSRWNVLQLVKNRFRKSVVGQLRKRSFLLLRQDGFKLSTREEGGDWPCFGYTMIGHQRLNNLQKCIEDVLDDDIPGDLIETGVWRGGATIFMRAVLRAHGVRDRSVWVADSFQGMPRPQGSEDGEDLTHVEYLKVPLEKVKSNFAKFGLLDNQVCFLAGWFKDTLPYAPIKKLSILRLDGDLYSSTMDALSNLYFKVSSGGYVIVDDYFGWEGCRRAVHEFLNKNQITVEIERIDSEGVFWRVH